MDPWRDLAEKVKAIRKTRNLSQAEFSQELGVAKSTLQKLEDGRSVSLTTLQHIAKQIGVELSIQLQDQPEGSGAAVEMIEKLAEEFGKLPELSGEKRKQLIDAARKILDILEEAKWK